MNEHKNIITIEDEIKEFSDKPVKGSALFNALKEKGVPDSSSANVGDVLTKGEDGIGWFAPRGLLNLYVQTRDYSCNLTYYSSTYTGRITISVLTSDNNEIDILAYIQSLGVGFYPFVKGSTIYTNGSNESMAFVAEGVNYTGVSNTYEVLFCGNKLGAMDSILYSGTLTPTGQHNAIHKLL